MIQYTLDEIIALLDGMAPGFRQFIDEDNGSWDLMIDDYGNVVYHHVFSELSFYVDKMLITEGHEEALSQLLTFAEELLGPGVDPNLDNAVATCFIESLDHYVAAGHFPVERIEKYLGERSCRYIREYDAFCGAECILKGKKR